MGFGRSCVITIFPFIGTLAAFVLSLLVVLGSIRQNVLTDIYFLRLDISNLTADSAINMLTGSGVTPSSELTTIVNQIINTNNPLPDFYTTALWNYCSGDIDKSGDFEINYCSDPKGLFWFNATEVLQDSLDQKNQTIVTTVLQQAIQTASNLEDVRNYMGTIEAVSKASFICYIIALCLLFLTLFIGLFSCNSRGINCCAAIVSALALLLTIVSAGLVSAMYTILRNIINDHLGQFGVEANLSTTTLGLAWGGVVAALWGTIWWIIAICCGSTRKEHIPEKEPFIPYNNYH